MKKALFYIIGICLALAACTDETLVQEQETTQQTFNVAIGETGNARQTKAAVTMSRYLLEMYEGGLSATPVVNMENTTGTFNVTMKKGVDYLCLFWADNGENAYDASSLQAVKLKDENQPGTAAYFAKVTVNSRSFNGSITLRRAVAELSFIDQYGLNQANNTLKITYPYASAVMNLGDGTVTYTPGETPAVRTFTDITPPAETTDAFVQDFILAPVEEGILAGLKFQLNSQKEKTISKTIVQANFQTKITGEYEALTSMRFTIDTRNGGNNDATFTLPLQATLIGYALSVKWGDGETADFSDGTTLDETNMTHIYTTPGAYTITISTTQKDKTKVQMPKFCFGLNYLFVNNNPNKLISLNTPLLNMGTDLSYCFERCINLTKIPEWLFENNPYVKTFSYCFSRCSKLTQIPEELFKNNTVVANFFYCFYGCSKLSQIPERLFENNKEATDFNHCFAYCIELNEIPEELFKNNTAVTNFFDCFNGCSKLTKIPEGLFKNNTVVTYFFNCFKECSNLTKIPAGLFANNKEATNFSSCFYGCSGLTQIPTGLFDNNTNVTDFGNCFGDCSNLTQIPERLFANNPNVTNFSDCFSYCYNLKPTANIFCNEATEKGSRFAGKQMNFNSCFLYCGRDTDGSGTLPALWEYTMEPNSYHSSCFNGANATNTDAILEGWK